LTTGPGERGGKAYVLSKLTNQKQKRFIYGRHCSRKKTGVSFPWKGAKQKGGEKDVFKWKRGKQLDEGR